MGKDNILFRGYDDGINIEIETGDFAQVVEELDKKLKKSINFYKGAKILSIKAPELKPKHILELNFILKYKYKLLVDDKIIDELIKDNHLIPVKDGIIERKEDILEGLLEESIETDVTKFINRTIRSGQAIDYQGSIVVIGDVNPGAILKATGHIIILGTFRGVAQAGINGNDEAIVAAYRLEPTQLRISDKIARSPDKEIDDDLLSLPEIAKIIDGELIIEPYLPNK